MLIYILFFILIAILAIQYEFTPFQNNYLLFSLVLLLAFLAGFQDMNVSKDYFNYQYVFDNVYYITNHNYLYLITFEPGFIAIVFFFRTLFASNYGVAIMFFYAFCSLIIKVFAIKKLSINPYLSLLFYFSYFFLLHEMTQIRIGLASAFFLISLLSFLKGNRRAFIGWILIATCFHYSAIFYLLLLIFNTRNFNKKLYVGILVLSIILGLLKLPILNGFGNLNVSNISGKLDYYIQVSENGSIAVNVFNSLSILNIFCCFYLLLAVTKEEFLLDKRLLLFLKCNILSIFLLLLLAGAPAFSMRFNQLFSIAQIFLFPYLIRYLPVKKFNVFIVVLIAGVFFYVFQIYGGILNPYKIILIK
jgi:hypothetical protein